MAVWIVHGPSAVGIDDGLIRARDFAHLVDAFEVRESAVAERERLLAEANAEADAIRASAREEAASLVAEAQASFEAAYQAGLERGLHDAATQWAGQALDAAGATRRSLYRQSERLSSLVSMAVERVIDQEDRAGLYRRSLRTIVKLVKDVPMLTMRVNEADREHAQRAVDEVMPQAGAAFTIEVVADPALAEGACRFESDAGVVDASLDTQLAALRRAVHRAAGQMLREDEAVAAGDDPQDELTTD
ncbi:MAG TPA: FliH/SctL family protein [Burkholderiaceae bacterium]